MSQKITPKAPNDSWAKGYFVETLKATPGYKLNDPQGITVKLDQNECPWDWPNDLKERVLNKVLNHEWNRYPEPHGEYFHSLLAEYIGVPRECIITGPGSNTLIPLLIDSLGKTRKGKLVIARPSFALFEAQCRYSGVDYEPWTLNENFEYDLDALPELTDGSMVIFANPNNPTGSALENDVLEELLKKNPTTLFVADEAYYEFAGESCAELLERYDNLIIMRTFSKTMASAGVRIGYLFGARKWIEELEKLRLPFMLNHFAMEAGISMMTDPQMKEFVSDHVKLVVTEREKLKSALESYPQVETFASKANFLLLRWSDQESCDKAYNYLISKGILLRNISKGPMLKGCLRLSIGDVGENDSFVAAMEEYYKQK